MLCAICGTSHDRTVPCWAGSNNQTRRLPGQERGTPLAVGTPLLNGSYVIDGVQSHSRFVISYHARQTTGRHEVVVKEFFPRECRRQGSEVLPGRVLTLESYNRAREVFAEYGRTLMRLRHPNLVVARDCFAENNTAYLVLESPRGQTLQQLVEESGAMEEATALYYLRQAGQGLEEMHRAGLLHGDVQPSNILICAVADVAKANGSSGKPFFHFGEEVETRQSSTTDRVMLIDFGCNPPHRDHQRGSIVPATLTPEPLWGGTDGYAPVEEYETTGGMSQASDVYSLGATAYFLLTGVVPTTALERVRGFAVPPLHRVHQTSHRDISRATSDAVVWALEVAVDDRPATISQFLERLPRHLSVALPDPPARPAWESRLNSTPARDELISVLEALAHTTPVPATPAPTAPPATAPTPTPLAPMAPAAPITATFAPVAPAAVAPVHKVSGASTANISLPHPSPVSAPAPSQRPAEVPPATSAPAPVLPSAPKVGNVFPELEVARPLPAKRRPAPALLVGLSACLLAGLGIGMWSGAPLLKPAPSLEPPPSVALPSALPSTETPAAELPSTEASAPELPAATAEVEPTAPVASTAPAAPPVSITPAPIKRRIVRRETIPFAEARQPTRDLLVGRERVARAGRVGVREVVSQVLFQNEHEVSRRVVASRIIRRPQSRIVYLGIGRPLPPRVRPETPIILPRVAPSRRVRDEDQVRPRRTRDEDQVRRRRQRDEEDVQPRSARRRRERVRVPSRVSNPVAPRRSRVRPARRRGRDSGAPLDEAGLPPL